jgi:KAP family P-loop domain
LSVLALLIPVIALVVSQQFDSKSTTLSAFGKDVTPLQLALLLLVAQLGAGVVHTIGRYIFSRASSFLPAELFRGPVLSTVLSKAESLGQLALRDPLYDAASGYLYLVQHDVREVLGDMDRAGYKLVIFIDDLDRCTPRTTAEVFEAINLFLSESFPRARFVMGLDPVIVTAHIDRTYTELVGRSGPGYVGDPSPGWTFLRKLVQLPIPLPRVTEDGTDRLLDEMLGREEQSTAESLAVGAPEKSARNAVSGNEPGTRIMAQPPAGMIPAGTLPAMDGDEGFSADLARVGSSDPPTVDEQVTFRIETHPEVRALLRQRLARQPDQSARHTKRLLTVWQFYVRILDRVLPVDADAAVRRARQLVIVAEIIARWPAQLRSLCRLTDGRSGIQLLAACHHDEEAWYQALERLSVDTSGGDLLTDLRELLATEDGSAAVDLLTAVT